MYHFS